MFSLSLGLVFNIYFNLIELYLTNLICLNLFNGSVSILLHKIFVDRNSFKFVYHLTKYMIIKLIKSCIFEIWNITYFGNSNFISRSICRPIITRAFPNGTIICQSRDSRQCICVVVLMSRSITYLKIKLLYDKCPSPQFSNALLTR